jgi:acyl-CoA reductase-like NAD-dependent aldehyde dehydrogenase
VKDAVAAGKALPMVLREQRIWGPRERLFERILPSLSVSAIDKLLVSAHHVDGIVRRHSPRRLAKRQLASLASLSHAFVPRLHAAHSLSENASMNATSIAQQVHVLGVQAKARVVADGQSTCRTKSQALRALAKLLRSHTAVLQVDNAKDIARATVAGLETAMVDRLKLTPQVLETCAQGCEQLATMPDIIGDIIGMKEQPSGIRVGQMRVPIGVFGMVFESRPNVTIEAASLAIKSGNACILRGGSEAIDSNKALAQLVQQALAESGLPQDAVQLVQNHRPRSGGPLDHTRRICMTSSFPVVAKA